MSPLLAKKPVGCVIKEKTFPSIRKLSTQPAQNKNLLINNQINEYCLNKDAELNWPVGKSTSTPVNQHAEIIPAFTYCSLSDLNQFM